MRNECYEKYKLYACCLNNNCENCAHTHGNLICICINREKKLSNIIKQLIESNRIQSLPRASYHNIYNDLENFEQHLGD